MIDVLGLMLLLMLMLLVGCLLLLKSLLLLLLIIMNWRWEWESIYTWWSRTKAKNQYLACTGSILASSVLHSWHSDVIYNF